MKKLYTIFILSVVVSLFACEQPMTFNEPQPVDTDNLSKIPKRIQGTYLSLEDSSLLIINEKFFQRIYNFDYTLNANQLDSSYRLSSDTLIDLTTNERNLVTRSGDTLKVHVKGIDTLFAMDFDNVVRKFKGYYFLNKRYDKQSWEVKKVQLSRGKLTISGISTKLDIESLKDITEVPQDTIPPLKLKATKKQFKEFLKNDGFSNSETFIRQ